MKKVALIFVLAVTLPSLVLAWLAMRSLRDQQFLLERQQSLVDQSVTDALAKNIRDYLAQQEQRFSAQTENYLGGQNPRDLAPQFDRQIRQRWPLVGVGFCVSLSGNILCPLPSDDPMAQQFLADNADFLGNHETAAVYPNKNVSTQSANVLLKVSAFRTTFPGTTGSTTNATVRSNIISGIPTQAEFAQLIGNDSDGMFARFLENKLQLMFWHRLDREPDLVFGAQLNLNRLVSNLRSQIQPDADHENDICVALLDDNGKPATGSRPNFTADWKHPFVSSEIGDALPHWEVAGYLANPAALTYSACIANIAAGLLIVILVLAIITGGWMIVKNLNAEVLLARQKTDFVSNVSHELKTPLTSIRMFSELLAEQRVSDPATQRSYLNIIATEAGRLTRLINHVLDFSHMERGEKKYNFQPCDLTEIARATAETFRPHLESNGFTFDCEWPTRQIPVRGDADALSQIIVNLLSNAEKYSNGRKEIALRASEPQSPRPCAEIKIMDRGVGVPGDSSEKIFEKFYRANNSLSSGIQGSGLGLTIARQIARAHGGDITYEPREGGGSCFILRMPSAIEELTR
ncbi:MAG TPA: HAMP domain-containing sensor histidine kinase [Verrucomicrobiae bacterium]|jgi:signal transduction histidine kinase